MSLDAAIRDAVAEAIAPLVAELAEQRRTIAALRRPVTPVAYKFSEAAEALGIDVRSLDRLIDAGTLPVVELPPMRHRRIPVAAVAALVASDRWQYRNVVPFSGVGRTG